MKTASRLLVSDVDIVGACRHDQVVFMQTLDLVRPPGDLDLAPFGEDGRMMSLSLGDVADPVRESHRVDNIGKLEKGIHGDLMTSMMRFLRSLNFDCTDTKQKTLELRFESSEFNRTYLEIMETLQSIWVNMDMDMN